MTYEAKYGSSGCRQEQVKNQGRENKFQHISGANIIKRKSYAAESQIVNKIGWTFQSSLFRFILAKLSSGPL